MNKNNEKSVVSASQNQQEFGSGFWRNILEEAIVGIALNTIQDEISSLKSKFNDVTRWSTQAGYIRVQGNRIQIQKPRVRNSQGEVDLETYKKMQSKKAWSDQLSNMALGGLASRQFDSLGQLIGGHYGLSKSQVSRNVVQGLKYYYDKLMETDCSDVIALMLDGIHFGKDGEYVVVGALGITPEGTKKILGIWAGGTENSSVVGSLLADLVNRGLQKPQLTLLDGSKALKKAVRNQWDDALIGRCQQHKRRNVLSHLKKSEQAWAGKKFDGVINAEDYETGENLAIQFAQDLKAINISACNSFQEGLPEILVPLLIENKNLRKFFSTTNALESVFSVIRQKTGRVKRWRSANSVLYWVATGYAQQKKNMRKIWGYKAISELEKLPNRLKVIQERKIVGFKKQKQELRVERQVA
jgi:transposase-like protein